MIGVGAGVYKCRIDFGPGYRIYFSKDGYSLVILPAGATKKASGYGYFDCKRPLARLQAPEMARGVTIALKKDFFSDTIQACAQRDSVFRKALLQQGVECLLAGDIDTGNAVLRDYINATIGFEKVSRVFDKSGFMRMFGPKGSPQASNLFPVIHYLQNQENIRLKVKARKVAW